MTPQNPSNNSNPNSTHAQLPSLPPISDQQLLQLCQNYGQAALLARYKFLGLLPEVNKRELWKKNNFSSIFEFAAKLAGISEEQVRNVLNLDKKFADKPILHSALTQGQISPNKLIKIASVVSTENEQFWAVQAENLSTRSLETLVKDEKILQSELHVQPAPPQLQISASIELKPETAQRLTLLKEKGLNIDDIINQALDQREAEIAQSQLEINQLQNTNSQTPSRHIPIKIRTIITQQHGTKCSSPNCTHPAQSLHHTRRFALVQNHNSQYIAPLCRQHHEIAHKIDLQFTHYHTPNSARDIDLNEKYS